MKAFKFLFIYLIVSQVLNCYGIYFKLGDYNIGDRVVSLDKKDQIVFTANFSGLIELINVSNPSQPELMSSLQIPDNIGGVVGKIAVYDSIAFVLGQNAIHLIKISNPTFPEYFGSYDYGWATDIIISGNLAYVAAYNQFVILDISEIQSPQLIGIVGGQLDGICQKDTLIFGVQSGGFNGFHVINVADPENPEVISTLNFVFGSNADIDISGPTVFLAYSRNFWSVDISDPFFPVILDTLKIEDHASKVFINEEKAYLTSSYSGFRVINISDPYHLNATGYYDTPGLCEQVIEENNIAYVANCFSGLQIIDVSESQNPYIIGSLTASYFSVNDIAKLNDYLFVAEYFTGLDVVNISNVSTPVITGSFFNSIGIAENISLLNNNLCLSYSYPWPELKFIDITIPENPSVVHEIDLGNYLLFGTVALFQTATYVYVGAGPTFMVFDVTDFSNPVLISSYSASSQITDIVVDNSTAYLSVGEGGIEILDLDNLTDPELIGTYNTPGETIQIALFSDVLIVADGPGGLLTLNVSDPSSPQLLESVMPNYNSNIVVKPLIIEDRMVIIDKEWNEIFTFDISDFSNISILSSRRINSEINQIIYDDEFFYCSVNHYGLAILDYSCILLTDKEQPAYFTGIDLYPNPASSFITINVNGGQSIKEAIICNHLGQKVLVAVPVNNTVDVSKLRPGIYFIEVITNESRAGTKLVVE